MCFPTSVYLTVFILFSSSQFEPIKAEEVKNTEALNSGNTELKDLKKKQQNVEIQIETIKITVTAHKHIQQCSNPFYRDKTNSEHKKGKFFLRSRLFFFPFQIHNLEETLRILKLENGERLGPMNRVILGLEQDLIDVRSKVEQQRETNKALLSIKMKLEKELAQYHELLSALIGDPER